MHDLIIRLAADWLVLVMLVVVVFVVWRLPKRSRYQTAARGVAMVLLALLFAKLASLFYAGVRPFKTLGLEPGASFLDNPGFPSDHATLVFSLTIIVWVATRRPKLALLMLAAAVVVAWARVAALVHTPLDVVAGAVFAALAGLCMYGAKLFGQKT